jgi:DNA modification methylase
MIIQGDAGRIPLPDEVVDCIVTDPPYGYAFMNKDWDKAVIPAKTWAECLRVLKPGAFAFIMSSPRQDVLSRMIVNLQDAGFRTDFTSIYWTYASGFPKAANIGKLVDKRLGVQREIIGYEDRASQNIRNNNFHIIDKKIQWENLPITKPATDAAKTLDGAYGGFQPKPAVEVVLVVMKPLSEKSFTDQALANGKGVTWLDNCRIPYQSENDYEENWRNDKGSSTGFFGNADNKGDGLQTNQKGRFPANLLVSDDILNDGKTYTSGASKPTVVKQGALNLYNLGMRKEGRIKTGYFNSSSGSYSRYFDLDKWFETTFPFAIIPKASRSERNRGLDGYITVKLLSSELPNEIKGCQGALMQVVVLLQKVTLGSMVNFSIDESGENIMALFPKDSLSTISAKTNKIIESKTSNSSTHSLISDYIQDVNKSTADGGNHVVNVDNLMKSIQDITNVKTEYPPGVKDAVLRMLQKIKGKENWQDYKNIHSTVKPLKLMSWLIMLGSRPNDLILDPFAGSGTTILAAQMLNRRAVGIEISAEYAAIARARTSDHKSSNLVDYP